MIEDKEIAAAVSRISQRAERQEDLSKLVSIYVDVGVLPQLNNTNHQIFYGRRGTGKTHVLKVLAAKFESAKSNTVVYLDCRTLGSTVQFSDTSVAMPKRCLALFRDILIEIYRGLQQHIVTVPTAKADAALAALDEMLRVATSPTEESVPTRGAKKTTAAEKRTSGIRAKLSAAIGALGGSAEMEHANAKESSTNQEIEYNVERHDKIVFPELAKTLTDVTSFAETKLYILIDEWSSLPVDVQPYLAEFIKRSVLPLSSITLKIAALEHRCRFSERQNGALVGFEVGADIAATQDLDDYFVFDRNPEQATHMFAEILYKHVSSDLQKNYLQKVFQINTSDKFVARMFTQRNAFSELVRASEGVVRDLINIFTRAFFYAVSKGRKNLDMRSVQYAARQWFEQDKATTLDSQLNEVLRRIIAEVIGVKKTRSFMVPRELGKHPVLQRLFDARVLHLVARGYADKDNTGVRYNIYNIDYGTYVDLIGTANEPERFALVDQGSDLVVPFDDKRKIRRVILNETVLQ